MSGAADLEPFYTGLREGVWRLPYCHVCAAHFFYPRAHCPYCFSDSWSWDDVERDEGTVETWTDIHRGANVAADELPLRIGLVSVAPRVRLLARLTGDVRSGQAVFCDWGATRSQRIPVFGGER